MASTHFQKNSPVIEPKVYSYHCFCWAAVQTVRLWLSLKTRFAKT